MASPRPKTDVSHALPIALALAGHLALTGCGPEHALSGAWQQDCDAPEGGCADQAFVYQLHVGRYGDDVTGLVVRYVNEGAPFDPRTECGCFVMQGGRATDDGLSFLVKLVATPAAPGDGPGCPAPEHPFASETCSAALAAPPCRTLRFDLSGDEDALSARLTCDDDAAGDVRRYVPARGKTRKTCLSAEQCPNLPDADAPSP